MPSHDTATWLQEYRDGIIGAAKYAMTDPKRNNECADRARLCMKQLRETEEGKEGIISLMSDDDFDVRLWAASDSLQWVPDQAKRVLEEIRDGDTNGLAAFEAKWTLREYEDGNLAFD